MRELEKGRSKPKRPVEFSGEGLRVNVNGISHIALTVNDLDRSSAWYSDVLGWEQMARGHDVTEFAYGVLPGGIALVLRQHDVGSREAFDEKRAGLDHLCLQVESKTDLNELESRLTRQGSVFTAPIERAFGWLLAFRDPDNIALEASCPAVSES
jgi:catechol 2,3-dioxygenase-like lactoylglutathione lyase family enzyme